MNGEILNLSAIHNGGKPELNVGIRGNSFTIKLSEDKTSLQFVDVNGNKLKLDGELLLQALGLIYLSTSIPSSDDYLPVFNGNDKIAKSTLTLTDLMAQLNKINNKADKAITLDGYGIKNAYTKTQIDNMLVSIMKYKGTYTSFELLTSDVSDGTITPTVGDVYNITAAGGTDASGIEINAGDNVVYNGTGWDCSSGTIDLSEYATTSSVNSATSELETDIQEVSSDLSSLSSTVSGHTSTISSMQTSLNNKANKSTTLSGYGITNAYTKTEVDSKDTTIKNSIPKVTVSTTPPTSSSSGKTGDIWIVYEN